MKSKVTLFRTANSELIKSTGIKIEGISASYYINNKEVNSLGIEAIEEGSNIYCVNDDAGNWNPNRKTDFTISFSIKDPSVLFGENGVTIDNGQLGLGIVWKSKHSNARGAEKIAYIRKSDGSSSFKGTISFEQIQLRGSLDLSIVIYMCNPILENSDYAQEPGTIVGTVKEITIILEGTGSSFSVVEKSIPNGPLWELDCSWDDPRTDSYSESVRIIINNSHPAWIKSENTDFRMELLKEIISTAVQIIVSKLDPTDYLSDEPTDYEIGSVSAGINYFVNKAEVDLSSPELTAVTLRKYIDKEIK